MRANHVNLAYLRSEAPAAVAALPQPRSTQCRRLTHKLMGCLKGRCHDRTATGLRPALDSGSRVLSPHVTRRPLRQCCGRRWCARLTGHISSAGSADRCWSPRESSVCWPPYLRFNPRLSPAPHGLLVATSPTTDLLDSPFRDQPKHPATRLARPLRICSRSAWHCGRDRSTVSLKSLGVEAGRVDAESFEFVRQQRPGNPLCGSAEQIVDIHWMAGDPTRGGRGKQHLPVAAEGDNSCVRHLQRLRAPPLGGAPDPSCSVAEQRCDQIPSGRASGVDQVCAEGTRQP